MKKQKETRLVLPREEWPYEVPENWIWTRLNVLKESENDFFDGDWILGENMSENGTVRLLQLSDIGIGKFLDKSNKHISNETFNTLNCKAVKPGDILISRMAEPIARSCIVPKFDYKMITAVDVAVLRTNNRLVRNYFLNYGCNVKWFTDMATSLARGTTRLRITRKNLGKMPFPLPPLPEQQRIVARIESLFSKLDAASERIRAALDQFPIRKAAILHKAFTGELTEKWREKHGVGMESWEHKTLSETDLKIIDGDRGKNYPKREELSDTGYCLFLNAKNVTKDGFSFDEMQFISSEKDSLLRAGKLERGDIVLTTRGTIGNIAYYDESIPYQNMRINSGMVIYRGGTQFLKPFLIWFYKSDDLAQQLEKLKTGTAQPQLPIKVMNNLLLPIPLIEEQKEIDRILDAVFEREQKTKEAAERLLEKIALTKKAILARAFRGKLGTNDPKEASAEGLLLSEGKEKIA